MRNLHVTSFLLLVSFTSFSAAIAAKSENGDPTPTAGSVAEVSRNRIQDVSLQIDVLVEKRLSEKSQKPNSLADDETFLRRIYLDIVGRIPTVEESKRFLAARGANKRLDLIDQLLDSPGYVSHQYNYWADILRIKDRLQGGNPGRPYIDFVKSSLESNQPYDQFVRELIASEGSPLERGNGATGYYLRDIGMPEDNMANTVRVFLGTRIECAQCHDHPFDKWTQRDFFEMVAFTGGMQTRMSPTGMQSGMQTRKQLMASDAPARVKQLAQNILRPLSYGVAGGGTGLARLPDSYQYDDGEPNEIVKATTLFADQAIVHPEIPTVRGRKQKQKRKGRNKNRIQGAKDIEAREALADWISSPENPRFSKVIANRMWKQAMGLALIEPLDDLTDESKASNPELMDYLTAQMVELSFDLKQFKRAVFYSQSYQREATTEDIADASHYYFPGPVLRRMSAEQLWDSFVTLAVPDVDTRQNPRQKVGRYMMGGDLYENFAKVKNMSLEEVLDLATEQVELQKDPKKRRERMQAMLKEKQGEDKFATEAKDLRRELAKLKRLEQAARKNKRWVIAKKIRQTMSEIQQQLRHLPTGQRSDLVRASELPSPAPAGHFLREFGQSDRDQIQNANAEAAVTQVLSLMNGQIEQQIIANPRTVLMRNVVQAESAADKIEVIFLSMLGRKPSRSERTGWLKSGRDHGSDAANDLIWTLANTSEFMFIR